MKNFYYKAELLKGYIPSDKVHHNGEPYESGGLSDVGRQMLKSIINMHSRYRSDKLTLKVMLNDIDTILQTELEDGNYEQIDKNVKPFYLNINFDGVDVFVHRWNWKEKDNWTPKEVYTCSMCGLDYKRAHSCESMINMAKAIG